MTIGPRNMKKYNKLNRKKLTKKQTSFCEKIEISDCIPYCVQEYIYGRGWHASLTTQALQSLL